MGRFETEFLSHQIGQPADCAGMRYVPVGWNGRWPQASSILARWIPVRSSQSYRNLAKEGHQGPITHRSIGVCYHPLFLSFCGSLEGVKVRVAVHAGTVIGRKSSSGRWERYCWMTSRQDCCFGDLSGYACREAGDIRVSGTTPDRSHLHPSGCQPRVATGWKIGHLLDTAYSGAFPKAHLCV